MPPLLAISVPSSEMQVKAFREVHSYPWELAAVGIDEGEDETANGAIVEEASAGQFTQ